jgi:hypothetical protein
VSGVVGLPAVTAGSHALFVSVILYGWVTGTPCTANNPNKAALSKNDHRLFGYSVVQLVSLQSLWEAVALQFLTSTTYY